MDLKGFLESRKRVRNVLRREKLGKCFLNFGLDNTSSRYCRRAVRKLLHYLHLAH
jgi:hypothetical protein